MPEFHPCYGGTIPRLHILPDTYTDVLGEKLERLQALQNAKKGWSSEKEQLRRDLEVMSPYFGYIAIAADPRDYILHRVGQSFQYDVPLNKRGHLARFRGIRIRAMCTYNGIYRCRVRIGPANSLDVFSDGECPASIRDRPFSDRKN